MSTFTTGSLKSQQTDLDDLGDEPGHWLQAHLGNVVAQGVREVVVVRFREYHPREQVRGDPLKERNVMCEELGQVDIVDGSQEEHALILLLVLQLQVSGCRQYRFYSTHSCMLCVHVRVH